jgi:hypothetical protein
MSIRVITKLPNSEQSYKRQGTDECYNPLTQTANEDSDDEMNI